MKIRTLALMLVAGTLLAQPPARRGAALRESLGLSDAQVQQMRDLRRQEAEASRPAREHLRQNRQAIREAMKADNPDAARVGQLMVDGKKLRESERAVREEYRTKVQALLTPEQKTKFEQLRQTGRKARAARQARGFGLLAPRRR